jgi:hypothetical protein
MAHHCRHRRHARPPLAARRVIGSAQGAGGASMGPEALRAPPLAPKKRSAPRRDAAESGSAASSLAPFRHGSVAEALTPSRAPPAPGTARPSASTPTKNALVYYFRIVTSDLTRGVVSSAGKHECDNKEVTDGGAGGRGAAQAAHGASGADALDAHLAPLLALCHPTRRPEPKWSVNPPHVSAPPAPHLGVRLAIPLTHRKIPAPLPLGSSKQGRVLGIELRAADIS